ncbi:MAG: hypothetical protein IJX75_00700 [Clostridia bacterium]|nr:hypothetical protein [Clostridia bacterium]
MGVCRDCIYFVREGMFNSYCTKLVKKGLLGSEYYQEVSSSDSCNYFMAQPTAENSGFTKSSSSCFLTSACVDYLGKTDNCEELTKLRFFRDTYLKKSEKGAQLIQEYYNIAPSIVEKIDNSDKKDEYYHYIYDIIKKCVINIDKQKYEDTLKEYKNMVHYLKKQLL